MAIDSDQFDRQKRISDWQQGALSKSRVAVIGAGALGNEVVKSLLQLGVNEISIVDYDSVVKANLNRCVFFSEEDAAQQRLKAEVIAEKARGFNASAKITPVIKRVEFLDSSFFKKFSAVFGCLDNLNARLHVNANSYGFSPVIDGGTTGFFGKVQAVNFPSSCLECSLSKSDYKLLWKKYSCVGEVLDFLDPKMPALTTTTSVVASIQVNEFLKLLMPSLKNKENLVGKYLSFNGLSNDFRTFEVKKRASCPTHLEKL